MNYQPFYNMNVLISDELLQALYDKRFAVYALMILTMFAGYIIFSLIEHLVLYLVRSRHKERPYISESL